MTDTELIEALAAKLRAYTTAPLADCLVYEWEQIGVEGTTGSVIVDIAEGSQGHIALGDTAQSLEDAITLDITGRLTHGDSQANRRKVVLLREQIVAVLRANRALSAGDETTTTNADDKIHWGYPLGADGDKSKRKCTVLVTYHKTPGELS